MASLTRANNKRKRYREVKKEAFKRILGSMANDSRPINEVSEEKRIKTAYSLINLVNMVEQENHKDASQQLLQLHFIICDLLEGMPIETFVRWFPIEKTYDGDRTGTKDYFYTRDYLCDKERIDNPIELLMEYQNWTITFYVLNIIGAIDEMSREMGLETPFEAFCKNNGVSLESVETIRC